MTVKAADQWVTEKWKDLELKYRIKSVLYEDKTDFQHMQFVDTYEYGKMLILDDIVQTTEKDEFVYHEMMAHVPMLTHPSPKDVLIIGGGDGGVLREVLRHPSVENATMVEIDAKVIDFSKKHLPFINAGALDDHRAEIIIDDGADYVRKTDNKFDIIIVDSPDPIGPAQVLFSEQFYIDIANILKPGGVMVRQTGSIHRQADEQRQAFRLLKNVFQYAAFYVYAVPTYVGGFFSTIFCSNDIDPFQATAEELNIAVAEAGIDTQYYNPGIHVGAFHIPQFMKDNLS